MADDIVKRLEKTIAGLARTQLGAPDLDLLKDAKAEIERLQSELAEAQSLRYNLGEAAREIERLQGEAFEMRILLEDLRTEFHHDDDPEDWCPHCCIDRALSSTTAGKQLVEELRAARGVVHKATSLFDDHINSSSDLEYAVDKIGLEKLSEALAAYDAVKEKG